MKRRLFLGIPLTEDVRRELKSQLKDISGNSVPSPNWHFTLHFLGEVDEDKHKLLEAALEEIDYGNHFDIEITHLGAFPTERYARILWVGVTLGADLVEKMANQIAVPLRELGFKVDDRPFVAHLTISRYHRPKNLSKWLPHHSLHKIKMPVTEFVLYESVLGEGAAQYTKLRSFQLKA